MNDEMTSVMSQLAPPRPANANTGGVAQNIPLERLHKVCVCGHLEAKHSAAIGGSHPAERETRGRKASTVTVLRGCCGEARSRNVAEVEFVGAQTDPDDAERQIRTMEIPSTCPCDEFRAVMLVFDPRFRFSQRRAARDFAGRRNRDPAMHALAKGARATATGVANFKMFKDPSMPESEKAATIERMVAERIRWIEGARRCHAEGCDSTDDVWAVLVDDDDRSELRCAAHR